ncbi:MAG: hypothetical protein RR219_05475 [Clostridiales bacterium]
MTIFVILKNPLSRNNATGAMASKPKPMCGKTKPKGGENPL